MSGNTGGCHQCYSLRGNVLSDAAEVRRLARVLANNADRWTPSQKDRGRAEIQATKASLADARQCLADHEAECTHGHEAAS